MTQIFKALVAVLVICSLVASDVSARGGRGGGGGGGRGGGGGGGRGGGGGYSGGGGGAYRGGGGGGYHSSPAVNRSPSMSRPSMPSQSRPNYSQPNYARPATGAVGARPSQGAIAARPGGAPARPGTQTARPGGPAAARPATGVATRPGGAGAVGARPSAGQLQSFLDLPASGGGANRGGPVAAARPAGGNAAVSNFLQATPAAAAAVGGAAAAGGLAAGNRADRVGERTDVRSDARDSRGENRDFASDNRQGRVENRGDQQAVRVDDRGELRSSLADGRGEQRTQRQEALGNHADQIRNELSDHYDHNHLFDDFWSDHPHAHYHFHQNPVFWSWAGFGTVGAFLPWNWSEPAYYDYGSGGNVVMEGDTVTVNNETYTTEEYAQQAEVLATSAPEEAPAEVEWLPLGVFAVTADGSAGAVPNMFLQLAVSKEGIIAGTYQNKTTGQTESVEGMVDKESQRAAWTIVGKNTPIMETGIANLTTNESTALVHFADGQSQQWLLVRLEKPQDQAPAQAAPPAQP